MKRSHPALWLGLVITALEFAEAESGVETGPKVAVHVTSVASKHSVVCIPDSLGPCSEYEVQAPKLQDLSVYLVVAQADTPAFQDGIGGVSLGIEYDGDDGEGVDIIQWTSCVIEYPSSGPRGDWPESGSGNRMVWETCQESRLGNDGLYAVVGVFSVYAYSNDSFKVTPNRNLQVGPELIFYDCTARELAQPDSSSALGWAGFGDRMGCNPCGGYVCEGPWPVQPTTWGRIKNKY